MTEELEELERKMRKKPKKYHSVYRKSYKRGR